MPKGQKRKSSKVKKNWRKADIDDVEDAMEDDRMITKLKNKALKGGDNSNSASALFSIDTAGSSEGISAASRREIARMKLFPPKAPKLGLTATEEAKIARAENKLGAKRPKVAPQPGVFDLWAPVPASASSRAKAEASTVRYEPIVKATKVPRTLNSKPSIAPAVLPAHEGQSMNPNTEAYEDLLCSAAAKQIEQEQEGEALDRKMKPMTHALRDHYGAEALAEMTEEEKVQKYRALLTQQAADAEGSTEPRPAESCRKALKIKAQSKRNRARKRRDIDAQQAQAIQQRKLDKSAGQIGSMLKEMGQEEAERKSKKAYRRAQREKRKELEAKTGEIANTRRLGKDRGFRDEALVIPDADTGKNGLRAMSLKGCAVKERLSSIVRRGMIDARPEATHGEVDRRKRKNNKLKLSRKYMSPLLRDNLLLK